jgi:hypothetical protein
VALGFIDGVALGVGLGVAAASGVSLGAAAGGAVSGGGLARPVGAASDGAPEGWSPEPHAARARASEAARAKREIIGGRPSKRDSARSYRGARDAQGYLSAKASRSPIMSIPGF